MINFVLVKKLRVLLQEYTFEQDCSGEWSWGAFDVSSCQNMNLTGLFLNRQRGENLKQTFGYDVS